MRREVLKGGTDELLSIKGISPVSYPVRVKTAGIYRSVLKSLILELKSSYRIYARPLALLMTAAVGNDCGYLSANGICFVPCTRDRERKRGCNPAKLLAEIISVHFGIPLMDCLYKKKRVPDQDSLTLDERRSNVEGAFGVVPGLKPPPELVLVDDVVTTGSTALNCASALISSGVSNVMVLAGGRAVLRGRRNSY